MEDNLTETIEIAPNVTMTYGPMPQDVAEDFKKSFSSFSKKLSEVKYLDSLEHSGLESIPSLISELSELANLDTAKETEFSTSDSNSVKEKFSGSVSEKSSTSFKKTNSSTSLISESISAEEPTVTKISRVESSKSKRQSVSQKNSNTTQETLSDKSEKQRSVSALYKTLSKQTHFNEASKILSNHLNQREEYQESKTTNLSRSDSTVSTDNPTEITANYTSPWAKTLPDCKPTQSQISTKSDETKDFNIKCIPPWAKTLRKFYGMTCPDPSEDVPQTNLQEKIKSLMDKHSRLMLVKRGESRKQLIIKPSECGGLGTVKMTAKNTRYYMTPIPRDTEEPFHGNDGASTSLRENITENLTQGSNIMDIATKTTRSQAKTEVSNVLKSLYNSKKQREIEKDKLKSHQIKCPNIKITPSKIRDFVNAQALDSDSQKLHEIIKIKKIPSFGKEPSSKYIINVPKCSKGDGTTVNKITVKEKRKIKIDSVEDINENVTQIIYNKHGTKTEEREESRYTAEENTEYDVKPYSKRRKSPTKSRTLEVTAETTPIITDLLKKEKKDKDKILLIQYEKKSKPCKETSEQEKPTLVSTQLLGIRQPCNELLKEMYLYGTETDGKKCKERITKVDDVSPTLREKVNMIFNELREMTFKPCSEIESTIELKSSVSSKTVQHPSVVVRAEAVSVQALPEVRSAEVQVHDSLLFSQSQLIGTQPSETLLSNEDKRESISEQESRITDVTAGSSTRVKPKRTRLGSKQVTDKVSDRPTTVRFGSVHLRGDDEEQSDEIKLLEPDEESTSEESKYSRGEIGSQPNFDFERTEDKEGKETDQSDVTQYDNQEEISPVEPTSNDKTSGEHLADEKYDHLEHEEILLKGERGSKVSEMNEDEYLKEDEDYKEIEREEDKEDKEEKDESIKIEMEDLQKDKDLPEKPIFTEDIRSYDFDPAQDYELKMISSSKFFHKRDSLRKLNWTDDILYLEKNTCPQLIRGLAEIAVRQPEDPISYLAHWIYKEFNNRESDEKIVVFKEHLEVAKGMLNTKKDEEPVSKKFSIRRYPMKKNSSVLSTVSEKSNSEKTETEELLNDN